MSKIKIVPNGLIFVKNENEQISFFTADSKFYIGMIKFRRESIIEFELDDMIMFHQIFKATLMTDTKNSDFINNKLNEACDWIKSLMKKDTV